MKDLDISAVLERNANDFFPVVPFSAGDNLAALNLSKTNPQFSSSIYNDMTVFSDWIDLQRTSENARYLVGGYRENRDMYRRSELFDQNLSDNHLSKDEPRSFHLGTDIWAPAGTPVSAVIGGMIHSFAFNDHFGDYGATIILQHQLETVNFYTLYGHLSLADLQGIRVGQFITRGETFAHFGPPEENGHWPPHLHFQVILDIGNWQGDYPGVCKPGEADKFLRNGANPDLLLKLNRYLAASKESTS
ncbi:MAG: peptidase [Ferruginibacter sp.]|nr:peptidase [Ferruginibacter sp.]